MVDIERINTRSRFTKAKLRNALPLMLMVYPLFLLVLLFSYVPLWGWSIAFIDYSPGVSIFDHAFVGFKHFARVFSTGSDFLLALRNTVVLSLLILATMPIPVIIAILINEQRSTPFKRTIQTMLSFPNFISWIIVYSLFFSFLSVDDGLINVLFLRMGWIDSPSNLLANPNATWPLMTFVFLWKTMGWDVIIYLAALSGIDQELYQAAMVDGANRLQQTLYITIPGILPTFAVLFILTVGNFLNIGFEQYFTFHNSLVHEYIEVLDTFIYRIGMQRLNFSVATAVGIFKTVVGVILLLFSNAVYKKIQGYSLI